MHKNLTLLKIVITSFGSWCSNHYTVIGRVSKSWQNVSNLWLALNYIFILIRNRLTSRDAYLKKCLLQIRYQHEFNGIGFVEEIFSIKVAVFVGLVRYQRPWAWGQSIKHYHSRKGENLDFETTRSVLKYFKNCLKNLQAPAC